MTFQDMTRRARAIVSRTLGDDEPEVDLMLISGALVARQGTHYRIELDLEGDLELESLAHRADALCDCGGLLSSCGSRLLCRSCGREFRF
jgi:hypothetical protein